MLRNMDQATGVLFPAPWELSGLLALAGKEAKAVGDDAMDFRFCLMDPTDDLYECALERRRLDRCPAHRFQVRRQSYCDE